MRPAARLDFVQTEFPMSDCKKVKRPCTCGKLFIYDRNGRMRQLDTNAACLSDSAIRNALGVMLQEWRRRCSDAELAVPMSAQLH
jgi:hypothetical protein